MPEFAKTYSRDNPICQLCEFCVSKSAYQIMKQSLCVSKRWVPDYLIIIQTMNTRYDYCGKDGKIVYIDNFANRGVFSLIRLNESLMRDMLGYLI